jgi:hypothetical protein
VLVLNSAPTSFTSLVPVHSCRDACQRLLNRLHVCDQPTFRCNAGRSIHKSAGTLLPLSLPPLPPSLNNKHALARSYLLGNCAGPLLVCRAVVDPRSAALLGGHVYKSNRSNKGGGRGSAVTAPPHAARCIGVPQGYYEPNCSTINPCPP